MKRLKTGVVNTLSFVKLNSFTVNSFDVTLEKVVGVGSLTITNLTDTNNLDICKDFIVINIDLILNNIDGGEYILSITNSGETYSYLTEVQDYQYNALGTGIYADSVYVSNELDISGLSVSNQFASESVRVFFADSLESAQSLDISSIPKNSVTNDNPIDLSELLDGTKKLYAHSTRSGDYIYWAGTVVLSNPNSNPNIPFAANYPEPNFYKSVSLTANQVTEVEVFNTDDMFPIVSGLNGGEVLITAAITKIDYVKPANYVATINPNLATAPYAYAGQPAWVNNSSYDSSQNGARLSICGKPINDDL